VTLPIFFTIASSDCAGFWAWSFRLKISIHDISSGSAPKSRAPAEQPYAGSRTLWRGWMLLNEGSFDTAPLAPPLSGPFRAICSAHSQPVAWLASYCATQPSKTNLIDALLLFGLRSCSETWEKASGKLPSFLDVVQLEWKPVFRRLVPESSTLLLLLGYVR
jgi:hypothetical protein